MQNLTISGKTFTVAPRYEEGHVLTANEASTLNQTFFENVRNNFANKAKDGGTQAELDTYVESYQFGVRTGGGGGSRDPIQTEAMNLAREAVKKAISAGGKKVGDYPAKVISDAAAKLVASKPEYLEKARQRIAEMQAVAADSIGDDIMAQLEAGLAADTTEADTGAEAPTEAATDTVEAVTDESTSGKRKRATVAE